MSGHAQTDLLDPFTGREIGIDNRLIPVIEALWALEIETVSSCEGHPGILEAVICFREPDSDDFGDSPEGWDRPADTASPEFERWMDAALEWEKKTAPDGARQVVKILVGTPCAHMTARWSWTFGDDPDNCNPGSALLLPTADIPMLASALAAKVTAEGRRRVEVRRAMWRFRAQHHPVSS